MTTEIHTQVAPLRRFKTITLWTMAAIPVVSIAMLYVPAIRTWIQLGVWPQPYEPDLHAVSIWIGMVGFLLSWVTGFVSLVVLLLRFTSRDRGVVISAAIGTIGAVLLWYIVSTDLGVWLLD